MLIFSDRILLGVKNPVGGFVDIGSSSFRQHHHDTRSPPAPSITSTQKALSIGWDVAKSVRADFHGAASTPTML